MSSSGLSMGWWVRIPLHGMDVCLLFSCERRLPRDWLILVQGALQTAGFMISDLILNGNRPESLIQQRRRRRKKKKIVGGPICESLAKSVFTRIK
jgi:hypothetical protein